MDSLKEIRNKLLLAMNKEDSYTIEEFHSEYTNVSHTAYDSDNSYNVDMFKFVVKFVNKSNNQDPQYATDGSSGFDLRANQKFTLEPGDYAMISTGLYFELPSNLEMQIRPRSGLAAKYGVTVLNSPGTIDSDYRGEIKIVLINHGNTNFDINIGDRIAQAVIATVTSNKMINFNRVSELNNDTERNEGGFGSTGIN
jgi:dUTP pyrophosphatase